MQRREEPQPVGGAHGLFQVAHLVQELLDGVVALRRAAFNHLHNGGGAISILKLLSVLKVCLILEQIQQLLH